MFSSASRCDGRWVSSPKVGVTATLRGQREPPGCPGLGAFRVLEVAILWLVPLCRAGMCQAALWGFPGYSQGLQCLCYAAALPLGARDVTGGCPRLRWAGKGLRQQECESRSTVPRQLWVHLYRTAGSSVCPPQLQSRIKFTASRTKQGPLSGLV